MPSLALDPAYRRITVEEFLDLDLRGAKAELDDGVIFMMAGGSEAHARIAANISAYLRTALRGTGCRPYGSDFAVRTDVASIRFPDVSVYCDSPSSPGNERKQLLGDPRVVFEVLSPSTSSHDQRTKLDEYRGLAGVDTIVFVDPADERVRIVQRTAKEGWTDDRLASGSDVALPSLAIALPHAEIFARD